MFSSLSSLGLATLLPVGVGEVTLEAGALSTPSSFEAALGESTLHFSTVWNTLLSTKMVLCGMGS